MIKIKTTILLFIIAINLHAQTEFSLSKLNEAYYNTYDYGFKGFKANIELDLIEEIKKVTKDETKLDILNNIKFYVEFFSLDSIVFTTEGNHKIGDEEFDRGLQEIVSGTEKVIQAALISWGESCLKPQLEIDENSYSVKTEKNITELNYTEEGSNISVYINNNILIDSIYVKNQNLELKSYLKYLETDNGKLILRKMVSNINNYVEMTFEINYEDFNEIKIPKTVKASTKAKSYSQELTYTFKNITLF